MILSRLTRSLSHPFRSVISENHLNALRIVPPKQPIFPSCGPPLKSLVSKPALDLRLFSSEVLSLNKNYRKNHPKGTNELKKGSGDAKHYILLCLSLLWPHVNFSPEKLFVIKCPNEFMMMLLRRPHLLDSIVVSDKGTVKVYPKPGSVDHRTFSGKGLVINVCVKSWLADRIDFSIGELAKDEYKAGDKVVFVSKIKSVESFEKRLKEALGIDVHNYDVPVRYDKWFHHVLWSFCCKILPSVGGTLYAFAKITRRI